MNPSGDTKFRTDELSLQASALRAQVLERCRRTLHHDMNNAVQSIHSGLELLSKCVGSPGIARITPQECINLLKQQFVTLQSTFRKLLSEIADPPGDPETFDFSSLLGEVLQTLRHERAIVKAGVQIDPELSVHARKVNVRSIVFGALFEAIDRAPADGALQITAARHAHRTNLEIRISAASIQRNPDKAHSVRELLGNLLHAEGGELRQEPEQTDFRMVLTVPSAQESSAESVADDANAPLRVLIADRNRDAADSLAMILQLEGHDAKAIYSGTQVLGMLETFSPHVVLFDSDLPGCDPGEVVNAARARAGKRALLAQVSSNDRVRHDNFDAHLMRPVEWPQLQALLRSSRAVS